MGLLDSVIGSVTGSGQGSSSGTNPMVKALLLLLAAKVASSYMGGSSGQPAPQPAGAPGSGTGPGSGAGTIQSGILKGMPSLDSILERFTGSGQRDKVESWVGPGENKPLHPNELEQALGPQEVERLTRETGLPRDQLLGQLSRVLPQFVDKLTPHGRLPTEDERARW